MAGDWIKMRNDLADDPAVIALTDKLGLDEFAVVGRLHRFWAWLDRHSENGNAVSVTKMWIDRYISATGFAQAMIEVGWLSETEAGISIPNFDRHNGQTAKKRGNTAKRVAKVRNARVTPEALQQRYQRREEKRREEKNTTNVVSYPLPPNIDTPEVRAAWSEWISYRATETKKAVGQRAAQIQAGNLSRWETAYGPGTAIRVIETSIGNGWKGLFEPKPNLFAGKKQPDPIGVAAEWAREEKLRRSADASN